MLKTGKRAAILDLAKIYRYVTSRAVNRWFFTLIPGIRQSNKLRLYPISDSPIVQVLDLPVRQSDSTQNYQSDSRYKRSSSSMDAGKSSDACRSMKTSNKPTFVFPQNVICQSHLSNLHPMLNVVRGSEPSTKDQQPERQVSGYVQKIAVPVPGGLKTDPEQWTKFW